MDSIIWASRPEVVHNAILVLYKSPIWSNLPTDLKEYIMKHFLFERITVCHFCGEWLPRNVFRHNHTFDFRTFYPSTISMLRSMHETIDRLVRERAARDARSMLGYKVPRRAHRQNDAAWKQERKRIQLKAVPKKVKHQRVKPVRRK